MEKEVILPPSDILETFLAIYSWVRGATGIKPVQSRDVAKHPIKPSTEPQGGKERKKLWLIMVVPPLLRTLFYIF